MPDTIDGLNAGMIKLGNEHVQMSPVGLPITYFEHAPSFAHLNGIISVTLTVGGVVPDSAKEQARTVAAVVTMLKCNIPAAIALRDSINGALLLAQPVEKPDGPAN